MNSLQANELQPINVSDSQNKFICTSLDDVRGFISVCNLCGRIRDVLPLLRFSKHRLDHGYKQFFKERIFKMNNSAIDNKNFAPPSIRFRNFSRLVKGAAPTFLLGGALALLMGGEIFAKVEGVDKIIQEVSTSILPNLKFGTGVVAGTLGLGIAIAGLLKTSPRMLLSGAGLAIVPATLWDSVVGGAATILIP